MIINYSARRDNLVYKFERHLERINLKFSTEFIVKDKIKLVKIIDIASFEAIDIQKQRRSLKLREWNDLLQEVRNNICSICGARSPKGECVNKKYHNPGKK